MSEEKCRSYKLDSSVCADGFIQKAFCRGGYRCVMCGNISDKSIPACLKDEIPELHANDNGSPRSKLAITVA